MASDNDPPVYIDHGLSPAFGSALAVHVVGNPGQYRGHPAGKGGNRTRGDRAVPAGWHEALRELTRQHGTLLAIWILTWSPSVRRQRPLRWH
jgi:hypothetical protein